MGVLGDACYVNYRWRNIREDETNREKLDLLVGTSGLGRPCSSLAPLVFFDRSFGELELIFWPTSFILMALEGPLERVVMVVVYTVALAANVMLYSILGLLSWQLLDPILRRHSQKVLSVNAFHEKAGRSQEQFSFRPDFA